MGVLTVAECTQQDRTHPHPRMSEDGGVNVPSDLRPAAPVPGLTGDVTLEIELLERQLARMRGMLGGYSAMFFVHMRIWGIVSIALIAAARVEPLSPVIIVVPFLVPFVFLEASYLFFYSAFARRHAAYLEGAIGARLGRPVLYAHTIEAAYFYDPAAPKISALSLARPLGHMSAMTVGYSVAAVLLWSVGMLGARELLGDGRDGLLVLGLAVLWTAAVTLYLLWTWLSRHDERRLEAALQAAYPEVDPAP